jgi:O-methyltransferase
MEPEFWPLYEACKDATMRSVERLYALYKAVGHVVQHDIPGDFVECGVWRGGSVMMMALALQGLGATRTIHCYDTFEGMPPPTGADVRDETGEEAAAILARSPRRPGD